MLSPRLTNCDDCTSIATLLTDIDCKLTELAKKQYNNIIYAFNSFISEDLFIDLLNYKRILTYKLNNSEYAECYEVSTIASKVKILINK